MYGFVTVVWQWLIFYFDYFFYPWWECLALLWILLSLSFSLNLYFKINFKIYFPIFRMLLSDLILVLILNFLRFPQALITRCLLTSIGSSLNAVSSVVFVFLYCPWILLSLYSHPSEEIKLLCCKLYININDRFSHSCTILTCSRCFFWLLWTCRGGYCYNSGLAKWLFCLICQLQLSIKSSQSISMFLRRILNFPFGSRVWRSWKAQELLETTDTCYSFNCRWKPSGI